MSRMSSMRSNYEQDDQEGEQKKQGRRKRSRGGTTVGAAIRRSSH